MLRYSMSLAAFSLFACFLHAEDLNTMLSYVPKEANVVMAIDMKKMLNTPVAVKVGWKKKAEETLLGLLPFPDSAENVVVAEQLLPGTLQNKWELVLISTDKQFSFFNIARAEKAEIETIGQTPVVFTKRNTVIIQLSSTLLGVFSPAHRQDVARWLRNHNSTIKINPKLAHVQDLLKSGNQFALIFDFEDTLEMNKVKPFVAQQKEVHDKKLNVDALSTVFSSMSSVAFTLQVSDTIQGRMRTMFNKELEGNAELMSSMVLQAFEAIGADMEEYRKGKLVAEPKAVELQAALTVKGFRSTLWMIQPHSLAPDMARKAGENDNTAAIEAQKVFRNIQNIANVAHTQAEKSNNIARAMVIYDNAATRLDKLPVNHVDPEIQQFAADVSRALREMASMLHSGVLEVQALESKIRTNVDVQYVPMTGFGANPWGFRFWNPMLPQQPVYNVQTNQPDIIAAQQEAITKAVRNRNEVWRQMIDKSATLKKNLSAKYNLAF